MKSYRVALVCLALTCGAATLAAQTPARPKIPVGNPIEGMASAYRAADRAFQEGDYKLARGLTIELATRFPQDAAVWLRLGQIEQALGMFGPSLAAYDRAIECETVSPVDGGSQMAVIRYHRARLLVAEASNDLAASSALPIEERLKASREALRRALDSARIADPLLPRASSAKDERNAAKSARGYVIEVPAEGRQ